MKKIFFMLFIALTSSLAIASASTEKLESVLKIKFYKGMPFTDIIVQNKKLSVLVDTGAADIEVFLKENYLHKLQVAYEPVTKKYLNSCGHQVNETAFKLDKLQLGLLQISNIHGIGSSKDFWCSNSNDFSIDTGLIGLKLLKNYNFLVDYSRKQLLLVNSHLPASYQHAQWQWVKFSIPNNTGIVTEELINGRKLRLIWDTGSNVSHLNGSKLPNARVTACPSSWKEKPDCKILATRNLTIANQSFGPAEFLLLPNIKAPFDGTIGGNFFENHLIYFDFKNMLIGIQTIAEPSKKIKDKSFN